MPSPEVVKEAMRIMTICNACRYCEGFCAVFPAMERRRSFAQADVVFLANLCFECRGCYYACPYAPPHEFGLNVPQTFAQLRQETYRDCTGPRLLSRVLGRTAWIAAACVATVLVLILALQGPRVLFSTHLGAGAFYAVVPYAAMVLPATVILLGAAAALVIGGLRFWRTTRGRLTELFAPRALVRASRDALGLTYLKGGGQGCNYPDARFSHARRWLHHLVFWGFALDLCSTSLAAIYHHVLHRPAPYPVLSWPVMLGTIGGVMLVVGCTGLLWLKARSDRDPGHEPMLRMDTAFLGLLLATSFTGLLVLGLRETAAMGTLLAIHLGAVAGLFLTLPYGKFAHAVYRYAALVQDAIEQRRFGKEP